MLINPYLFLLSLFFGLFVVYIFSTQKQVIMAYPTPDNEDKNIYIDKNNSCYKYKSEEVKCPRINYKNIPLQDTKHTFYTEGNY